MVTLRRPRHGLSRWADAALALVVLAVGESQVWLGWSDGGVGEAPHGRLALRALMMAGFTVPLAWRRRQPLAVVVMICAAIVVQLLAVAPQVPFLAGLLPMAVANYTAAAYAPRLRAFSLPVVFATQAVIYARIPAERVSGEVLFAAFVALGTWIIGDVVRIRSTRAERAMGAARTLVAEREASARATLADERARIAQELHDVIAHSVSVMGVQAGAARTLMDTDADAAREALRNVEATARSSVAELQRLLTVLRTGGTEPNRAPQPGLAQLPALVAQVREAGLPVELSVSGMTARLPPGIDLAAYRIVQEALTNALKHAGAPTTVNVARRDGHVQIEVRDVGPGIRDGGNQPGHGLIGMRERALLYGGTLDAGPDRDGGFVVRASLPVGAETVT